MLCSSRENRRSEREISKGGQSGCENPGSTTDIVNLAAKCLFCLWQTYRRSKVLFAQVGFLHSTPICKDSDSTLIADDPSNALAAVEDYMEFLNPEDLVSDNVVGMQFASSTLPKIVMCILKRG